MRIISYFCIFVNHAIAPHAHLALPPAILGTSSNLAIPFTVIVQPNRPRSFRLKTNPTRAIQASIFLFASSSAKPNEATPPTKHQSFSLPLH
jgi:hypothetical protein